MKLDLAKASYEGREFEFAGATLTIRPYPASRSDIQFKDGAIVFPGASARDMFFYCLTKWENVIGTDDQPLKLTDDVKKKIFDFKLISAPDEKGENISLADFVMRKAREMSEQITADTKN
jgi:hypothetical protein